MPKNEGVKNLVGIFVRHGLTLLAGLLAAHKMRDASEALVSPDVVGAIAAMICALGWSLAQKAKQHWNIALAAEAPEGTKVEEVKAATKEVPVWIQVLTMFINAMPSDDTQKGTDPQ